MRILYHYDSGPALDERLATLAAEGLEVVTCPETDDDRLFSLLPTMDVLWHCLRPIDTDLLDAAPRLRLIQKIGVGVNTIDLDGARARGIAVCNLPGSNSRAVAEHVLALTLAVLRQVPAFDALVRADRGWTRPAVMEDRLGEIAGRRIGLVGYGAVPRILAPILAAMGAEVSYTARTPKQDAIGTWMLLDDLIRTSDILSLHVPLNAETARLIDGPRIRSMPPGAVLINTARGGLVDAGALVTALSDGHLAGAGLDVFATEPLPGNNPLSALPNVVLTPHTAWLTQETLARSVAAAAANCHRLARGEPLHHRVA